MPRRGNSGRVIDFKAWLGMAATDISVGSAQTNLGSSLAFTAPGTILRCRGYVQAAMDATKQVDDTIGLAFGLCIASTEAVAAGAASVPDPFDEVEYPWLWWGSMFLRSSTTTTEGNAWGTTAQRLEVDTKAMRRFKPEQSLVWVVQSATVSGAPATDVTMGFTRVLIGT